MAKKKTWISVKVGIIDPKHQEEIGPAIWLFLYLCDRANWEKGQVFGYTDGQAAEDLGMEKRTIRAHRTKLQAAKYIGCRQRQSDQVITIHNWTDPRKYSGKVINPPDVGVSSKRHPDEDDTSVSPSEIQDDIQGDTQGDIRGDIEASSPLIEDSPVKDQESKNKEDTAVSVEELGHQAADQIAGWGAMAAGRRDLWPMAPEHIKPILEAFTEVWEDVFDRKVLKGDRGLFLKQAETLRDNWGEGVEEFILDAGKKHKERIDQGAKLPLNGPLSINWAIRGAIHEALGAEKAAEKYKDFWDAPMEVEP